ncbi:MAG: ABC transporter ATP-binding protein [Clostridia bacterium]|nr:ABC transporter ATP-binding protein [Clostridia bacterium]
MQNIIEVKGLEKSYGSVKAVKGIDFNVKKGQLFAFLGPNGAGKSTTVEMLCTLLEPNSGSVKIDGFELGKQDNEIRSRIGVVFQDNMLDGLLTVEENLKIRGSFYGMKKEKLENALKFAAENTGATDILKRKYSNLSGGQRRRADIARALMHSPEILFMDEPTTGLDPQTRKNIWETIRSMQQKNNMTVFLTTHYMEEAAQADYVVTIVDGKIAACGTPAELREKFSKDTLYLNCKPKHEKDVCNYFENNNIQYNKEGGNIVVSVESTISALPILNELEAYIDGFEVVAGTMDDAFIAITGRELQK